MRFAAAFGIVIYHNFMNIGEICPSCYSSTRLFSLFVDLFFVISGIVITMVYHGQVYDIRKYLRYLWRRFTRLYPLHFATLSFYVIIGVFASYGVVQVPDSDKYDFSRLLPNLLMLHAWGATDRLSFNYVSWSISAEFFVYLIFPLMLLVIFHQRRIVGIAVTMLVWLLSMLVVEFLVGQHLAEITWDYSIVRATASFAVGMCLYRNRIEIARLLNAAWLSVLANCLSVLLIAMVFFPGNTYYRLAIIYLFVGTHLAADINNRSTLLSTRIFTRLSGLTYTLYMTHTIAVTVFVNYAVPRFFGNNPIALVLAITASILSAFLLAIVTYNLFEMPMRLYLNKWGDRWFRPKELRSRPVAVQSSSARYHPEHWHR